MKKEMRQWGSEINPGEVFLDYQTENTDYEGIKLETPINPLSFKIFGIIIFIVFSIFIGRLIYLQVIKYDFYQLLAEKNCHRIIPIFSLRGDIVSADGKMLATYNSNGARKYPEKKYFAHIIGYLGQIDSKEREKYSNYFLNEKVGRAGLEDEYQKYLRGEPGRKVFEINSQGEIIREASESPPRKGNKVVLAINADLQKKIYQEIEKQFKISHLKTRRAAAVAINPQNGQIMALVSYPSFDNNIFSEQPISQEKYHQLVSNRNLPLFNRALQGEYPPGSIIKPLMASAALQEGIVTQKTILNCPPYLKIGRQLFRDWKPQGRINIIQAIAESSDVFFYQIGGGYKDFHGLNLKRIVQYLKLFGLGDASKIDLPGENQGLVPDENWKRMKYREKWYIGDTYHLSIGQGYLLVTPLQMAVDISAIVNGGTIYQPQIVDKIINSGKIITKFRPNVVRRSFIDQKYLKVVKHGMRKAVLTGTARQLKDLPVSAGGKTGTAEVAGKEPHSWFVAFAPYDHPQIVLVVLVENGGEGYQVAEPIVYRVMKWWFNFNQISR